MARVPSLKAAAIGLLLGYGLLAAPQAHAAAITLGSASTYGVLSGTSQTVTLGGGFKVTGNLGIGKSDTVNLTGSNTVTGTEYKDSSITTHGSGSLSTGGVVTQSMTTAINDANNASIAAGALTGTAGMVDQGGSINLNGTSVTIKALTNLSENVLNISALSLMNGTLTFDDNGYTGAKFIINVTGAFTVGTSGSGKSLIQGINGASAADIIFNIEGSTGGTVSLTGNSSSAVIGTILAPSRNVTLGGGGTLTGSLIAGVNNAGKSSTLQSTTGGYNITDFAYKPSSPVHTPEPSSMALLGAGLIGLAAFRRRRAGRSLRK